jgi:hypothetical protein
MNPSDVKTKIDEIILDESEQEIENNIDYVKPLANSEEEIVKIRLVAKDRTVYIP